MKNEKKEKKTKVGVMKAKADLLEAEDKMMTTKVDVMKTKAVLARTKRTKVDVM